LSTFGKLAPRGGRFSGISQIEFIFCSSSKRGFGFDTPRQTGTKVLPLAKGTTPRQNRRSKK